MGTKYIYLIKRLLPNIKLFSFNYDLKRILKKKINTFQASYEYLTINTDSFIILII